jgi:hypothetical protein
MRAANWDVVRLSKLITKGMTVIIEGPPPEPRPVIAKTTKQEPAAAAPPPEESKPGFFRRLFGL